MMRWIFFLFVFLTSALCAEASPQPVVVAIFDSGIDATHPLLKKHLWKNPGNDIRDLSPQGHGTHVSGLVIGFHKTIIPEIKIMPLVINPANPGKSLLKSLEYAETHGALLFSISFSQPLDRLMTAEEIKRIPPSEYPEFLEIINQFYEKNATMVRNQDDFVYFYDQYQHDFLNIWHQAMEKIQLLQNKMLIIASAGNNGLDLNRKRVEPATLPFSNIISVMNLDPEYKPFSHPQGWSANYGSQRILLGAIGTNVLSTAPGGQFKRLTGASQAVPKITHECAKIALKLQKQHITPTPQRIKEELLGSLPSSELLKQYTITGKYLPE